MTKHVVSTLSADNRYAKWITSSGVGTIERSVLVRGKALVATKGMEKPYTPLGAITHISDDDARFLSEHALFKEHQSRGHVKIVNTACDPDAAGSKMPKDDGSRPKTPEDVRKAAQKLGDDTLQVVTNSKAK